MHKSSTYDDLVEAMTSMGRKYSKDEAGFQAELGMRGLQCGECANLKPDSKSCSLVEGSVELSDVCHFFEPSPHIGDMASVFAKSKTFDMYITKASKDPDTEEMRWAAVASDTDLDSYKDKMSIELFSDFIERIEGNEAAPPVFTSEAWQGGMPYLGLAHYLDLDGRGIVGDPNSIYIDGNRLKSKGIFRNTSLGEAAFEAVKADQADEVSQDERIRISIAFMDWSHAHGEKVFVRESLEDACPACAEGDGDKIYLKGQLIHLALTRVPVNERTPIWLEERAMISQKEDAASVLGKFAPEGEIDELDELSKKERKEKEAYKSEAVIERSEETATEEVPEEAELSEAYTKKSPYGGALDFGAAEDFLKQEGQMYEIFDSFAMLDGVMWNIMNADSDEVSDRPAAASKAISQFKERVDDAVKRSLARRAAQMILNESTEEGEVMTETTTEVTTSEPTKSVEPIMAEAKTPLDLALEGIKSAVLDVDSNTPLEERLAGIQPAFNSLAEVVKSTVKGDAEVQAETIAGAIAEAFRAELQPLVESIQLMAAKSAAPTRADPSAMIPGPRAMQPSTIPVEKPPADSIRTMVNKSVGLPE